jgi:hypothetical protein
MTVRRFETTNWETLIPTEMSPGKVTAEPAKEHWKLRHYLAALSAFLIFLSPLVWVLTNFVWAAMVFSMALLLFFVFALLIPSSVYHLDEEHDFGQ